MTTGIEPQPLQRKDFVTDQEVRWCPGCGDYSILAQTQKILPDLGVPREKIVFISGIGCSSRLPYYVNTYGFHSIHGRAPTIATGLKITHPDLKVFVVTGDGDGLSIGGNHLLHAMRRNIDITIILFNNRIYGLTKGQYSPTSEFGKRTKSSPVGTVDQPLHPLSVAIGAEATFVARSLDIDQKHLIETLERAARHKGTSFVEVYQNCNVFNDGAFMEFADKAVRADRTIQIAHGKPMVFGKELDRGIRLNGITPEVVELGNGVSESDLWVHDETRQDPALSFILSRMHWPEFPEPMGVVRAVERPTYEALIQGQVDDAIGRQGPGDLDALFMEGDTWTVE
jgi:2-oxoglutarate ferredoxin oxidoreductase subunit beta